MDIVVRGNGLHTSETRALDLMKKQLRDSWYGYASVLIADRQSSMEFDLLMITHDRLLVIELKEWNGKLTNYDGNWLLTQGRNPAQNRGKSAYHHKRDQAIRLSKLLREELEHKLGYYLYVEAHVVLCGSATPEHLTDTEKLYVHSLSDFLKIRDDYDSFVQNTRLPPFDEVNRPRPNTPKQRKILDSFFRGNRVLPAEFKYMDYVAEKVPEKVHYQQLFSEYSATHVHQAASRALMRRWDLTALGLAFHDENTWRRVAMREDFLYRTASAANSPLEQFLMRPIAPLVEEAITSDCIELYQLRKNTVRLQQYLALHGKKLTKDERLDITKALLAPFAELHSMGFAHRDIDMENLWYSKDFRIMLVSGFHAAFIPEKGTVKDLAEQLRGSNTRLPEDIYSADGEVLDPFTKDVYLLALVAHRICFPDASYTIEDEVTVWRSVAEDSYDGKLNAFFAKAMNLEQEKRFANAGEMLAELNTLAIGKPLQYDDTLEVINAIREGDFIKPSLMTFNMMSIFVPEPGTEQIFTETKVAYQCKYKGENAFLKLWPKAVVDLKTPGVNRRILRMRKRIEQSQIDGLAIPSLLDYGMLVNGAGLYIVTRFEEGEGWAVYVNSLHTLIQKIQAALALCHLLMGIHCRNFAHGDLHPGNVLVRTNSEDVDKSSDVISLLLIDVLDYGITSDPYNVEFGPKNPSSTDSIGRDCFAVYKMVEELLGAEAPQNVMEEISLAKEQPNAVPVAIEPLANNLEAALVALQEPEKPVIIPLMLVKDLYQWPLEETLLQQSGQTYYLSAERDRRNMSLLYFRITAQEKKISFNLDPESGVFSSFRSGDSSFSDYISASQRAHECFEHPISIRRGTPTSEEEITFLGFLLNLERVQVLLGKGEEDVQSNDVEEREITDVSVSPAEIWKAMLDTEGDQLTRVEIISNKLDESQTGAVLVSCFLQDGRDIEDLTLGSEDDGIGVYLDGEDRAFGEMVPDESGGNILAIRIYSSNFRSVKPKLQTGTELVLESKMSSVSRARRSRALQRVLSGLSRINNLPAYFDVNSNIRSKIVSSIPDESDIRSTYDNADEQLNSDQVIAFQRMVSEGPITTLQGPPGTGKTDFVSKFIHYLFAKGLAKNVLLVGQSHASVDTVAIKAREVCENMGTELSLVRLGQESSIDDQMLCCHPSSIQRQIRSRFQREYEQRVNALSSRLALTDELVEELAKLHRSIYPILERVQTYLAQSNEIKNQTIISDERHAERLADYDTKIQACIETLERNLETRHYDFKLPSPASKEFWSELSTQVARRHGISNQLALQRLNNLIQISQDWIDVLGSGAANYNKFLTKTSQLVCGTLVGIGAGGINIEEVDFDFVIVDEAGRAQASELMIAMQCGRRVLLVGDHMQLPPVYDPQHIRAVAKKLQINESDARRTDFERAFTANVGQRLSTQYRMVRPIGEIISNCFYDNDLKSYREEAPAWCKELPFPFNKAVTWIDSGEGNLSVSEEDQGQGKLINRHEVDVSLYLLRQLSQPIHLERLLATRTENSPYPIGLITMYRGQKRLIEERLSRAEWAVSIRNLIKIDTVDSFQGGEAQLVILSLVRNNEHGLQGFLIDQSRINVALSRAKQRLVIIGSKRMWSNAIVPTALSKVVNFITEQHLIDSDNYEIVTGTCVIEGTSK